MPKRSLSASLIAAPLTLALILATSPAFAGFQWVSPDSPLTVTQAPAPVRPAAPMRAPMMVPTASAPPEVISPVIISGDQQMQNTPVVQSVVSQPVPSSTISVAPPPASVTVSNAPPSPPPVVISSSSALTPAPVLAPVPAAHILVPLVSAPEKPANDLSMATISVSPPPPAPSAAADTDIVKGFASQIPLTLALRQLLPTGYNFSLDQNVDMNTLVSYKGGKSWRDTLRDMLTASNLTGYEQGLEIHVSRAAEPVPAPMPAVANTPVLPPLETAKTVNIVSAPPARMEMPGFDVNPMEGWTAQRGSTLRKVLTDWCNRSGTELQWQSEYDYPVEASAHFTGTFEDAIRGLLAGFETVQPQPVGELHNNPGAGQMVLVVQARGNSVSN